MTMGLPTRPCVPDHPGHRITDERFGLATALAVGHQRHTEGMDVVARGVRLGNGQMVGIEVNAKGVSPKLSDSEGVWYGLGTMD